MKSSRRIPRPVGGVFHFYLKSIIFFNGDVLRSEVRINRMDQIICIFRVVFTSAAIVPLQGASIEALLVHFEVTSAR
jgi:hypothetical protein